MSGSKKAWSRRQTRGTRRRAAGGMGFTVARVSSAFSWNFPVKTLRAKFEIAANVSLRGPPPSLMASQAFCPFGHAAQEKFRPWRIRQNREDLRLNKLSTVGLLRLSRQGHASLRNDNGGKLNYIEVADDNSGHRADFGGPSGA